VGGALGCADPSREGVSQFPAPDAVRPAGPGAPARTFAPEELFAPCGYVLGGPGDVEHHNLVGMHDGWLIHPWSPEDGGGGVSLLDVRDPCAPAVYGQVSHPHLRETHTLAVGRGDDGREYLAVDMLGDAPEVGGVGFIDITDRAAPVWVSELATPGFYYPDSYLRVTFASVWVGSTLYVAAAFNGVHVVDVSDPRAPVLVDTVTFDPPHLVGKVEVLGNRLFAFAAGTPRLVELDASDPWAPRPIANGNLEVTDATGEVEQYYYAALGGRYGLFARGERAGGPILYDLTTPGAPVWVGEEVTEGGDGAYVYRQKDRLFQGDSAFGIVWDIADPADPVELARVVKPGDLDTMSPISNVFVFSVDSGGAPGQASSVIPFAEAPDAAPPAPELTDPPEGAVWVPRGGRIGVAFDEWLDGITVHAGSFRVFDTATGRPVPGRFDAMEAVANFTPDAPLAPDTTYVVELPAGGISDAAGNPLAAPYRFRFSTGPRVTP
jgi:hypothetical protein